MVAYYNEIDPFAAEWLRELIRAGHIAPGFVDERSIKDVRPDELSEYTQCHFFAGIGVWSYALRCARWPDDRPVWTGSCPCQPFSAAGKGKGVDDERHLWPAFEWLIGQCKPDVIYGEQVAGKAGWTWFDVVSADLEGQGYACGPLDIPACYFGANHKRLRLYWVAVANSKGMLRNNCTNNQEGCRQSTHAIPKHRDSPCPTIRRKSYWDVCQPESFLMVDGATNRVGRLRGYGNAIVAPQAQAFIEAYMESVGVCGDGETHSPADTGFDLGVKG